MAQHALTLAAALVLAAAILVASRGYGRLLAGVVPGVDRLEPLVHIALGTGVLGYAAFALAEAGALRVRWLLVLLVAGLALGLRDGIAWTVRRGPAVPDDQSIDTEPIGDGDANPARDRVRRLYVGLALLAAGFALFDALLPEIEYDALWYHLTFPLRYLQAHRLLDFPCDHMAPTPQHVEMLYTYALMLGDARTAKLVHFACGAGAALAAAWLAARLLGRRWGALTAALVLGAPTVMWEMSTAYNDLELTFVATVAVVLLVEWHRTGARKLLVLAALLFGVGLAGKHLGYFFVAPLAIGVLVVNPAGTRRTLAARVGDAALLGALAVLVALPWYVRAWHETGNPLYPMFWSVLSRLGLPLRRWDAAAQAGWNGAMARYGNGRSPVDLLLVPWHATWDGVRYAGSLGSAWLLFLPPIVLVWRRLDGRVRALALLALVYWLLWISPVSSFQVRYLVPIVPVLAIVAAAIVRELARLFEATLGERARAALLGGTAVVIALQLPPFWWFNDARVGWIPNTLHEPRRVALGNVLGVSSDAKYLEHSLVGYPTIAWMNDSLPPGARVVWFGEAAQFYSRAELVPDYSQCVVAGTWGAPPGEERQAYEALRRAGITHIAWYTTRRDTPERAFAIRSPTFLSRYATPIHADRTIELDALR